MATYVFDGTTDVSIANFNAATDTLIVDGVDIADVGTFSRTSTSFVISLESGVSVSLSGANLDALTDGNFSVAGGSDIDFAIGDGNPDGLSGNLGSGGFGADNIAVTTDEAIIYGNQQNDFIDANGYENLFLVGGAGNDTIGDVGGGSIVYGGLSGLTAGEYDYVYAAAGVTDGITMYGGNGSSDSMDGRDYLYGGNGNDLIYGNAGDDYLFGYEGDDEIFGGMGNDTIYGDNNGTGDDKLYGNTGDDTIYADGGSDLAFGGQGDDSIYAYNQGGGAAADAVLLSGGLGADTIFAFNSVSENITIYGGNGASDTTDGNDSIYGSLQGDLIYGNAGNDSIFGYSGDDTILGGIGDDTIDGYDGVNAVTGGAGNDTFVAYNIAGGDNFSVITDFTKGEDLIDVSTVPTSVTKVTGTGATEYDTLNQVVTDFGTILAGTAEAVTITNGDLAGITFVLADTNADGAADQVIAMTGFTGTITATDFV